MNKYGKLKANILNIFSFFLIFSFLIVGLILILLAAKAIPNSFNKPSIVTCYVFGSLFLVVFLLIISKMIFIMKAENRYKKNAVDVDKYFADVEKTKSQEQNDLKFANAPKTDKESRNIYFSYLLSYMRKTYRRPNLELKDYAIKCALEDLIIEIKTTYGIFDVYLAIEFTKSLHRKMILRGEYNHYKVYFDGIRKLINLTNEYVRKLLNFS